MPVLYDGKQLRPSPFVRISKEYLRNESGKKIGVNFNIILSGTLVADRGSPASVPGVAPDWSENFWIAAGDPPCEEILIEDRLEAILRKQEAIRCLFANDGLVLEVMPLDGDQPLFCNPRVISIEFSEGIWLEKCDYAITLQADSIYGSAMCTDDLEDSFADLVSSTNEEWLIEFNDTPQNATVHHTFRVTHNVSATGKHSYDDAGALLMEAWEQAKSWCESRLGYDSSKVTGGVIQVPGGFAAYNHVRSETIGEESGTYAVSENWILSTESAIEDFTVTTRESIDTGITTVSIDGSIVGLETIVYPYAVSTSKYTAAISKWTTVESALLTRAQTYSGLTLNIDARVANVGKNPVTGVINYSYEYDNRPSNCITGALSEVITITDIGAGDVFAVIPVIGRAAGPVLQDICTVTETRRSLNIEAVMPKVDGCVVATWLAGKPDITTIRDAVKPVADQVFAGPPVETWVPSTGRYSYQIEWTYQ